MEQSELPGVRPKHIKRLEEIQDRMDKIGGAISRLREEKRELNAEAVEIVTEHKLEAETIIRDDDEWYLKVPEPRYAKRRYKQTDEGDKKAAEKAAKKKASA